MLARFLKICSRPAGLPFVVAASFLLLGFQNFTADDAPGFVDFSNYQVNDAHLQWLMPEVGPARQGFQLSARLDRPELNLHWPGSSYYQNLMGPNALTTMASWGMRPVILYASPNGSGSFQYLQDMAEGSVCVDDTSRAALFYIERYLQAPSEFYFETARGILNWLGFMLSLDGRTYNFAWLDAPVFFKSNAIQSMNQHYFARSEFQAHFAAPASDPATLLKDGAGNPVVAPPFRGHSTYSIFMNDLTDASGNNVATRYDLPLYQLQNGTLVPTVLQKGLQVMSSTSTSSFSSSETRTFGAFARALKMLALRERDQGLNATDLQLKIFIENHLARLENQILNVALANYDSRLAALVVLGLVDVLETTDARLATKIAPQYLYSIPGKNGTAGLDQRPDPSRLYALLDNLTRLIVNRQRISSDWSNGIFLDDPNGNWQAWGQVQIQALARAYQYKVRFQPAEDPSVALLLDRATYAADTFYGNSGYNFRTSVPALRKNRVPQIVNWNASFQSNADQPIYDNSSIVLGLYELSKAWSMSGRTQSSARKLAYRDDALIVGSWLIGGNSANAPLYNPQTGVILDGLIAAGSDSVPSLVNTSAGGESNVEGLRALLYIQKAIREGASSKVQVR